MREPKNWKKLTVKDWKEFREVVAEDFDSVIDYKIERFSVLMDIDNINDYWRKKTVKDFKELSKVYAWANRPPTGKPREEINGLYYKGLDGITLGEYIDLSEFCNKGFIENFERICSVQYRKRKTGEWGEVIIEPYSVYSTKDRASIFEELPITDVYGVLVDFLEFRGVFMEKFAPLFEEPEIETDEEEEDGLDPEPRTLEQVRDDERRLRAKRWAWGS